MFTAWLEDLQYDAASRRTICAYVRRVVANAKDEDITPNAYVNALEPGARTRNYRWAWRLVLRCSEQNGVEPATIVSELCRG